MPRCSKKVEALEPSLIIPSLTMIADAILSLESAMKSPICSKLVLSPSNFCPLSFGFRIVSIDELKE